MHSDNINTIPIAESALKAHPCTYLIDVLPFLASVQIENNGSAASTQPPRATCYHGRAVFEPFTQQVLWVAYLDR